MAAIRWYLTNGVDANGWQALSTTAQSAATLVNGWVVGTGSTNHSEFASGAAGDRASTTFTGTTVPDGTLDTSPTKDAFRIPSPIDGTFASANWTFQFAVVGTVQSGAADGQILFRLIKANADGTSATEITSGQQSASVCTNVGGTDINGTLTFNPGAITLGLGQYLFIQVAWKRTGAGGMTTTNIRLRAGVSASVGTTILSSDFTPANKAVTTKLIPSNVRFPAGAENPTPWFAIENSPTQAYQVGLGFEGPHDPQTFSGLSGWLSSVEVNIGKDGTPTTTMSFLIRHKATGTVLATSTNSTPGVVSFAWTKFTFATPIFLPDDGGFYELVPVATGTRNNLNYHLWTLVNTNPYAGGYWGATPDVYDANFRLYTTFQGGPTVINQLQVTTPALGSTATVGEPTVAHVSAQAVTTAPLSTIQVCSDGFDRADGLLHGSTLDNGAGGFHLLTTVWNDIKGAFEVNSNAARARTEPGAQEMTSVPFIGTPIRDQSAFAELVVGASANRNIGVICRWQPGLNPTTGTGGLYYLYYAGNGKLYKADGTSLTELASGGSFAGGYVFMQIEAIGSTIKCYRNFAEQISVTDTSYPTGLGGLYGEGNPNYPKLNYFILTATPFAVAFAPTVTVPVEVTTATIAPTSGAFEPAVSLIVPATVGARSLFAFWIGGVGEAAVAAQEITTAFIGGVDYVLLEDESGPIPLEDEPFGVLLEGYAGGASEAFAPTVAIDTATYVTGATIASTSTLTSPTVTTGAVTVLATVIAATALLFVPTLLPQAVTISGPTRPATSQVFAPSVAPGAVTITAAHRPTTIQVFAPTVVPQAVTITTAHRATTIQVFAPTVVPQAVTVIGATIGRIFPSVTTRLGAQQGNGTTVHPITLPTHVAGDLLLVIWSVRTGTTNTNTLSGSGGWTTVYEHKHTSPATQFVLYKIATGSSESLTITTSVSSLRSSHVAYRLTGATQVTGTASSATSIPDFDPPSHTPSGGVQDYLWLTALSQQLINSAIIPPANYLNAVSIIPTLTSMTTGAAEREVSATSEDPGAWTNASTTGVIGTIAVWPGVPVSQAQPPIITPGAVTVGGATIAATSQLFSPSIVVGPATVAGVHIGSTAVLYAPALTQLAAGDIGATHIPTTEAVHAPSVVGGLATITVPFIAATSIVRVPSVAVGPATVLAATRASTTLLFPPSVVPLAIGITAGTRPTTIQVFAPTVTRGAVTVGGATISTASAVHAPTVIRTGMVTGQTVASSLVLFSPSVTPGAVPVTGSTVVGLVILYPPSIEQPGVTTGPLPSGTLLFPPSLEVGPAPIPVAPCMESTVVVRYLASSFALECKMLVVGRVEVETLTMSTIEPHIQTVTATIRVRTLVSSEGLRTCCLEVQP